jgi:hypothetical protein
MRILYVPLLLVLPGAWVAFGLRLDNLTWTLRLALALTLSPLVLPTLLLLLKFLGLSFAGASWIALILNLPAALLIWRRTMQSQLSHDWQHLWPIVASFAPLAMYTAYPWFTCQPYRVFGWHNFMQLDMIYVLARKTLLPEEPQMAGLPLAYPWFSHSFLAVVGWLSDVSPTYLLCVINPVLVLVCVVFWYAASRRLGLHPAVACFVVGLIGFSGNFIGTVWGALISNHASEAMWWGMRFGDFRTGPFLAKFNQLQAMNFGLTVFSSLVLVCVIACRERVRFLAALVGVLLAAVSLIYVTIFPVAVLLVGCLLALMVIPMARDMPAYTRVEIIRLGVALLLAGLLTYAYMAWMTSELTKPGMELIISVRSLLRKAVRAGLSLLIPGTLAMYVVLTTLRQRRAPILLLAGASVGAILLFIFTRMSSNAIEYKFLFCAIITLALLAGSAVDTVARRHPKMAWAACGVMVTVLLALHLFHSYLLEAHYPPNLTYGPQVDEGSFWVSLDPSEADAAWTRAVRERTPEDTVIVVDQTRHHLGSYLARSLLVPVDRDNWQSRVGYTETGEFNLVTLRGYPQDEFKRRLALIDSLYTETDPGTLRRLMQSLRAMNRPIVIHFARQGIPLLQWLKWAGLGRALFTDSGQEVWFIDRAVP